MSCPRCAPAHQRLAEATTLIRRLEKALRDGGLSPVLLSAASTDGGHERFAAAMAKEAADA